MKILKKLAPHAAILIGNMYYVFWGIDRVNKAMNFIDNGYTKGLLALLIGFCAVNAASLLPVLIGRLGRTDSLAPVFVRLGILAVNALLAAVIAVLLIVDLFNEDLMLFLNEFVKILILLLCVTGLLAAVQVTARERAYIRAMNRRAAQRRPVPQPRPAQRPQEYSRQPSGYSRPTGGYSARQEDYSRSSGGYSGRESSYGRQPGSYSSRQAGSYSGQSGYTRQRSGSSARTAGSYSRPSARVPEPPRSRYENRR